jgi:hypothetical protein
MASFNTLNYGGNYKYHLFNIKILGFVQTVYLCVSCKRHNKQWLFPCIAFNWLVFVMEMQYLLNNTGTKFLNSIQMNVMVQNDKVLFQHLPGQTE